INLRDATGIPQDRERLFLVAASQVHFDYNPFRDMSLPISPPPTSEATVHDIVDRSIKSAADAYLPEDNQYHKMISREMARGQSTDNLYQLRRNYVREKKDGACPTLTANMGLGGHNVPFVRDRWGIRRLSVTEVAQLQGFDPDPDLFPEVVPQVDRYRLLGNAACPGLAELAALCCLRVLAECE
ncbi:MAG: DNA cytosine methyltransferase, partial [Chloroflexi bacterium]|nr:DNA cytosine methyltransferase [Chloroflexota bacterium]